MIIYKYPLPLHGETVFTALDGNVLCVKQQGPQIVIYIAGETDTRRRRFKVVHTGEIFKFANMTYIGTVMMSYGNFVAHVYECHYIP